MLLLIVAAACGGLLLAVAITLVLEHARSGFRSLREITESSSLPGLGALPLQAMSAFGKAGSAARSAPSSDLDSWRFALQRPSSPYARHLQAIRTRLVQSDMTPSDKVVVVISALPGEGKSTFACNFALTAASSGLGTLLIDGDIYTAATSRAFGLSKAGLCEVLDGKISVWNALFKDETSGLYVLGAHSMSAGADEPRNIDAAGLAALLGDCRKEFDLVVLDSPAILPVGGITPHLKSADCAVLVVEWDSTPRQAVAEVLYLLDKHALKIAGVVLNKVSPRWFRLFDYSGRNPETPATLQPAT